MMRLSEYSLLLEKESARLKKLRAGTAMACPGSMAGTLVTHTGIGVLCGWGVRAIRIPHDDRYLVTKQTRAQTGGVTVRKLIISQRTGIIFNKSSHVGYMPKCKCMGVYC